MSTRNPSETSLSSPGLDASTSTRSPRTGAAAAPVSGLGSARSNSGNPSLLVGQLSSSLVASASLRPSTAVVRRRRSSGDQQMMDSSATPRSPRMSAVSPSSLIDSASKAQSRSARKINDAMVYLDGPQIYACAQCRTHLTSHDEIISKSFHGRHGRAYLFDHCVNVSIGPPEDRLLITGLHSVCDIFCKRCKTMVGWTYAKAYETSQKYKEGKFIVEKINLHLEESDYYDVATPAGERKDRFRARSISWGSDCQNSGDRQREKTIYEYQPSSPVASSTTRISHG